MEVGDNFRDGWLVNSSIWVFCLKFILVLICVKYFMEQGPGWEPEASLRVVGEGWDDSAEAELAWRLSHGSWHITPYDFSFPPSPMSQSCLCLQKGLTFTRASYYIVVSLSSHPWACWYHNEIAHQNQTNWAKQTLGQGNLCSACLRQSISRTFQALTTPHNLLAS